MAWSSRKDYVCHVRFGVHMDTIEESIEVDAPIRATYNQWTRFEEFPEFMEGIEAVDQVDDKTVDWRVDIGGKTHEFRAEIYDQQPDKRVAWRSIRGRQHGGAVEFEQLAPDRTLVRVEMIYDTEGFIEKTGSVLGVLKARVKGDLKRFKNMIEEQGAAPGGWRGEIEGDRVRSPGDRRAL